jgi:hypothetical protein
VHGTHATGVTDRAEGPCNLRSTQQPQWRLCRPDRLKHKRTGTRTNGQLQLPGTTQAAGPSAQHSTAQHGTAPTPVRHTQSARAAQATPAAQSAPHPTPPHPARPQRTMVPLANLSNSNTPMGPFHTTVLHSFSASLNSVMLSGPMSRPCCGVAWGAACMCCRGVAAAGGRLSLSEAGLCRSVEVTRRVRCAAAHAAHAPHTTQRRAQHTTPTHSEQRAARNTAPRARPGAPSSRRGWRPP